MMDMQNLKDLSALLKLCRKQGVNEITLGNVSIKFGDMPMVIKDGVVQAQDGEEQVAVPSDEDMAYWSAAPDPLAERQAQ